MLPAVCLVYLCPMWGRGMLPTALPAPFSATLSPAIWAYLHECGASGSASSWTACPIRPILQQFVPPWPRESSPPWLPISALPTGLDEYLFFISLVSDFLAFLFSVSCGCARRHSVSTYTAILVPPEILLNAGITQQKAGKEKWRNKKQKELTKQ